MRRNTESVYIEAPVERVFDYFKDPANWNDIAPGWPFHFTFTDVKVAPGGEGTTYAYTGKVGGVVVSKGTGELTQVIPNQRVVDRAAEATVGTRTVMFEPVGSGTAMTMVEEWEESPAERIPLLGAVASRAMAWIGTRWMADFKTKLEN